MIDCPFLNYNNYFIVWLQERIYLITFVYRVDLVVHCSKLHLVMVIVTMELLDTMTTATAAEEVTKLSAR